MSSLIPASYNLNCNQLSIQATVNLFLYGVTQTPINLYERIYPQGYKDGVTGPTIFVDASSYMGSGPGRYAVPGFAPLISAFFDSALFNRPLLGAGVYTLEEVRSVFGSTAGANNDDLRFQLNQYQIDQGSQDYAVRTFVHSSTGFVIGTNSDLRFIVGEDGAHSIENIQVRPFDDNFDFDSGTLLVQIYNQLFGQNSVDPFEIGRKLNFEFVNKENIEYFSFFSTSDYINSNHSVTFDGGILSANAVANNALDLLISQHVIEYGNDETSIIYGDAFSNTFLYTSAIGAKNYIVLGGADNDVMSTSILNDRIYGHEGNDTADGGAGNDNLFGGSGNDHIFGGVGADRIFGDFSNENFRGAEEPNGRFGDDYLYANDQWKVDDLVSDRLEGGLGDDSYFVGDKDIIRDTDGRGEVRFGASLLTGATQDCNSGHQYVGAHGELYSQSGGNLTVTLSGKVITVEGWSNGELGIRLNQLSDSCGPGPGGGSPDGWGDPLIFDLDGDGIETTEALSAPNVSVYFDIDNDGLRERINWVGPDDGFLVFDANNNGEIDNASELFGDASL